MSGRSRYAFPLLLVVLGLGAGTALLTHRAGAPAGQPAASAGPAVPTAAAATASPRFPLGTRRAYSLVSTRTIRLRQSAAADAAEETLRYELSGTWETTVLAASAREVVQLGQLLTPQLRGSGDADATLPAVVAGLAVPFFLQLDPSGRLHSLRLRKDVSAQARGFIKAVAAQLQLVLPEPTEREWTTQESDPTGEYAARYALLPATRLPGQSYAKSRQQYLQVATAQGLAPVTQVGKLSGELDLVYRVDGDAAAANLQAVTGHDRLEIDPGPGLPHIASRSEVALHFLRADGPVDVTALAALANSADYELVALAAPDAPPSTARSDDERLVKGASLAALMAQLSDLPQASSGPQRAALHVRLSALFRLDGSAARQAMQAVQKGLAEPAAKTVIGALGGAGTAAAQAALVQLAESQALAVDLRENALAVLGLAERPEDSTAAALLKATTDANSEVRSTAALALGNVAAGQRKTNPGDADQSVDELLALLAGATNADDQIVYLQALGNAGDPRALPALQAALQSDLPAVRNAAVVALRFIDAPPVDALIAATLQDRAAQVRRGALFAASLRNLFPLLPAIERAALTDSDAGVRMDTVDLLAKAVALPGVGASAAAALGAMATKDPDPEVRRAAQSRRQTSR